MLVKLNADELGELQRCNRGPFGKGRFYSFVAALCAPIIDDGELDLDRHD
jgi:hypothetical protein